MEDFVEGYSDMVTDYYTRIGTYMSDINGLHRHPVKDEIKEEESSSSDLPQGQGHLADHYLEAIELSPPRELVRERRHAPPPQAVAHRGGKRPRADMFAWRDHHVLSVDSEDDHDGRVDLKSYFRKHRVSAKQQVIICRSYASYVNAKVQARKRPALDDSDVE